VEEREMRSEGNLPELGEARRRGWGMAAAAPLLWWRRRRESRGAAVCFVREGRGGERGRCHRWRERWRPAAVWRVEGEGRGAPVGECGG